MTAPLLEIEDLRVHFPIRRGWLGLERDALRAVDGFDLVIGEGETVALVGESGCGKSTVGNAVLGLAEATGGAIRFRGRDLLAEPPAARATLRREMQVVSQDPATALNPKLRVGASIAEPLTIAGEPRAARRRRVAELMEVVGLNAAQAARHPHELSGGQRQRVVIARALARSPRLVICDEPVSALDVSIRSQILNLLMRLQEEFGLSYLFISHDLSVVRHVADRVSVMYLGAVVEEGPAETVFARPTHPYTEALLAAIPLPDPVAQRARAAEPLRGDLPSPIGEQIGCRFASRCPLVEERCRRVPPALAPTGAGTRAACLVRNPAANAAEA